MSRLLATLLLYKQGYVIGRYINLKSKIEKNKESYYIALEKSGIGWHKNKENPVPFIKYLLRTLLAAYIDFEERVDYGDEKIPALELVRGATDRKIGKITKREMMYLVPSAGKQGFSMKRINIGTSTNKPAFKPNMSKNRPPC